MALRYNVDDGEFGIKELSNIIHFTHMKKCIGEFQCMPSQSALATKSVYDWKLESSPPVEVTRRDSLRAISGLVFLQIGLGGIISRSSVNFLLPRVGTFLFNNRTAQISTYHLLHFNIISRSNLWAIEQPFAEREDAYDLLDLRGMTIKNPCPCRHSRKLNGFMHQSFDHGTK